MATKKPGMPKAHIALTPAIADHLLDLLSTDNSFRRAFKKDPANALLQIGHEPTGQDADAELDYLRTSLSVERLASKDSIARSREEIRKMLTNGLSMIPIQLNVEGSASRRTRK